MDLRAALALIRAHAQSAWNRTRFESGLAGPVATVAALGLVATVLIVPGVMLAGAGLGLGRQLITVDGSLERQALVWWCWLQALFTVLLAVLGGLRHRRAFTRADIGAFPVSPLTLLAAEIPASIIEVFPLLAVVGMVCSALGLAVARPPALPLLALLLLSGILQLLLVQHLVGSLKRLLLRRPVLALTALALVVSVSVAMLSGSGGDPRPLILAGAEQALPLLPGSMLCFGLADLLTGSVGLGLARVAGSMVAMMVLLALTVVVLSMELGYDPEMIDQRRGEPRLLGFSTPVVGLARLLCRQIAGSRIGLVLLGVAPLIGVTLASLLWVTRVIESRGDALPAAVASGLTALQQMPMLELLMLAVVWMGAEAQMNQFGWDRRGVRTILALPLPMHQILLGKMLGMAAVVVLQALLAAVPLLLLYRPTVLELGCSLGAAGSVFIFVAATGHVISARFPRPIDGGGASSMPLYLSWLPGLTVLVGCLVVGSIQKISGALAAWLPAALLPLLLLVCLGAYLRLLPRIGAYVSSQQERLLSM